MDFIYVHLQFPHTVLILPKCDVCVVFWEAVWTEHARLSGTCPLLFEDVT